MSNYVVKKKLLHRDYYASDEDIEKYNKREKPSMYIDKYGLRRFLKSKIRGMTLACNN